MNYEDIYSCWPILRDHEFSIGDDPSIIKQAYKKLTDELANPDCCVLRVQEILSGLNAKNCPFFKHTLTVLHTAVSNPFCSPDIVRLLLREGACHSSTNSRLQTPLHVALESRVLNFEIVQILIEHSFTNLTTRIINERDSRGYTPLCTVLANPNCNLHIIKFLVSRGAKVSWRISRVSSLEVLLRNPSCNLDMVKFLLDHFPVESIPASSYLYLRNYNCQIEILRELIERGAASDLQVPSPFERNNYVEDFLNFYRMDYYERELMNCDMTLSLPMLQNCKLNHGILHLTVQNPNCYEILLELLEKGNFFVNSSNISNDDTPLHRVVRLDEADEKVVSLLLKHGASVHKINHIREYPLFCALKSPRINLKIVKMLLDAGSPICKPSKCCMSSIIERYKIEPARFKAIVELLIKYSIRSSFEDGLHSFYFPRKDFICEHIDCSDYGHLSSFTRTCYEELEQMKKIVLKTGFLLFNFIYVSTRCIKEEITIGVLKALSDYNFTAYRDIIVDAIDKSQMVRHVSDSEFYNGNELHDQIAMPVAKVFCNHYCIEAIARYLSKFDLLNLILACCKFDPDH